MLIKLLSMVVVSVVLKFSLSVVSICGVLMMV